MNAVLDAPLAKADGATTLASNSFSKGSYRDRTVGDISRSTQQSYGVEWGYDEDPVDAVRVEAMIGNAS